MTQRPYFAPIADDGFVQSSQERPPSQFASVLLATIVGVLLGNYLYERRRVTSCIVETNGDTTVVTPTYGG